MASTSTGYHKATIVREQPSSSGQVMSWTSGCILNIQSGAELRLKSGGIFKSAVTNQTSANKSIPRDGISVIESTIANTMTISAIPQAGIVKKIVTYSTFAQTIRGASSVGVLFGATSDTYYDFTVTNSSKTQDAGIHIELLGHSTNRWHVKAVVGNPTVAAASSAIGSAFALSTACT